MSNQSSNWTEYSRGFQYINLHLFHQVLMPLEIILIVFIIAGNSLTILAICRYKHLRIASYVMIGALSTSDLLVGLVYTPLMLLRLNKPDVFEHRLSCLIMIFFGQSITIGNVIFHANLCLERFYAVQFPYHYHSHVTVKHNLTWSICLFLGIFLTNLPVLCGVDLWHITRKCYGPTLLPGGYVKFIALLSVTSLIAGLLAFIRVLVAELSLRRHDRRQELSDLEKQTSSQSTLIIFAYAVSMCLGLPHMVYYLSCGITNTPYDPVVEGIMHLLDGCNSAGNCLIYGFKNRKFRAAFKRLLGIKGSHVESLTGNTSTN